MTDERAIEILGPEHREHYESIEPVNEACRIGMEAIRKVKELRAENAALRSGMQYLIDDGGADCCAKCVYCPQPTEEDDDCDCQHKGECVDGMIKWFEEQREEQQGGTE